MLEIPTKPRPPKLLSPRRLLIYGETKVGKTTNLVKLPNNLILDLESGAGHVEGTIIDVREEVAKSGKSMLAILREVFSQLNTYEEMPFKFISFDTVDALYEECAKEVAKESGVQSIADIEWGAGYDKARKKLFAILNAYSSIARIILVGHRKRTIIGESSAIQIKELDLVGKLKNMLMAEMDAIGYVYRNDGKLYITFETANEEAVAAGSRFGYLAGKTLEFDWNAIFPDLLLKANKEQLKAS